MSKTGFNDEILPKKEWGYCVECQVNGYRIVAPDRNRFEAIYAALDCARWCSTLPPFKAPEEALEGE